MERIGGPRRWANRATFVLTGVVVALAFVAIRALTVLARIGRYRGPSRAVRRVLMLPHDSVDQAGTRYRILAWAERLRAGGVGVRVAPPNSPEELRTLYGRAPQWMEILCLITLVRRTLQVLAASRFDAVLYARAVLPRFPFGGPVLERLLSAMQPRTVLDLDDALWAYDPPRRGLPLVGFDPGRTDRAMALAWSVSAGNGFIAGRARRFCPRVHVVPTCVDADRAPRHVPDPDGGTVVGWIGTPGNLRHLVGIVPALRRLGAERPFRLRVVSSVPFELPGIRVQNVLWSAAREARDVAGFDVGLMPLADGPAFEGKCGLKLLQYAAAGIPAVASPVGVNRLIVRDGETGFLATTDDEWAEALTRLLDDPELRARMGAAAREEARRRWSYEVHEAALRAVLGVAGPPG